ncbi:MAG: tyrosine-type recombinase/integrase [Sphaerochaeta sp.]
MPMKKKYRFRKQKGRKYYEVMFNHIPGKWYPTYKETQEEAILFAESFLVNNGLVPIKKETTLSEFAKGFFTEEDPHGYRHRLERRNHFYDEGFFERHQARLDNYILKSHGGYFLSALTDVMIEDFVLDLKSVKKGRQLSDDSRNKVLACYRIVLQEAVREGYIKSNPAKDVVGIATTYTHRKAFTKEEIQLLFPEDDNALLSVWGNSPKWAVYFCIMKDTGWRPGEIAGLQVVNWYPEIRGIYTTDSVDRVTHQIKHSIKTTRRGQKFKAGFLEEQTARLLQQLILTTRGDFLFEVNNKGLVYAELANKHLKAAANRVNLALDGRTQYCFRHTFNTLKLGTLPETARLLLMGHTHDRPEYNHLEPLDALRRVKAIENNGWPMLN